MTRVFLVWYSDTHFASSSPDNEQGNNCLKFSYGEKKETDEMVVLCAVLLHLCVS